MINQPALDELKAFIEVPTALNASRLVTIPSLHWALELAERSFFDNLLGTCGWLHSRGTEVMENICKYNTDEGMMELPPLETEDWRVVRFHSPLPDVLH
jgi:hypothetical protein